MQKSGELDLLYAKAHVGLDNRDLPGLFRIFPKAHSGFYDLYIMLDLFIAYFIKGTLLFCGLVRSGMKCSRKVSIVAMATHNIGIKTDQLIFSNNFIGCFLKPGIGATSGIE